MENTKYKAIDLFCGIGGIRRGFELTGKVQNVLSAEIDKYAVETYQHLYGDNAYNDVKSEEFKNKVIDTEYDILLAGFPCQAFSIAGKKEGFLDRLRGTLFFDVAEIIDKTKPKVVFLENVGGLTIHDKGKTFRTILETLVNDLKYCVVGVEGNGEQISYDRNDFIRNTKDFGLPQSRTRTYIVAFRSDLNIDIDNRKLPKERMDINLYKDLDDLLEYGAEEKYYVASGYLETLKKHKSRHGNKGNGFGYVVVNSNEREQKIANTIMATGGSGKERNLVLDYQKELVGKVVKNKKTPLSDEGIRHMTPIEWGKLQGFINYGFVNKEGKDEFSFPEKMSDAQKYKQFGNSVSITVIETMAKFIIDILENK